MPYINTRDNVQLHLKDWGSGRPVILIHGWPLSADSWDEQAVGLAAAGHRVIAYDRRGFGRSSQPWDGYDYDTLADDLAAVVDYAGAGDVTLVGFSMAGGEVARYMSRHRGKKIARAVLVSSVVPFLLRTDDNPGGVPKEAFAPILAGIGADRPGFFAAFFKNVFNTGTRPVSDERLHWAWNLAMQASLKSTLACAQSFATTDFRPDLASFKVPTLIIHGTSDQIVPIDVGGRAAARAIPGARLIEYEGAPHGVFATDSQRLTQDLLAFIG
jgi:non-heme chloroperoxidase